MSLSEQEQRALREIERSLLADDPKFGASVSESSSSFGGDGGGAITLRGVALVVLGLVVMIGGVALAQQSLWFVALSVLGFLLMFGAGVWMLRGDSSSSKSNKSARSSKKSNKQRSSSKQGGVSSKMEENFRRRFEER